jgi:Family of unknown function (DUF5771)
MNSGVHEFKKSKPYDPAVGCSRGYHKRSGYTVKRTGKYVPPRCVRSTTTYKESSKNYKKTVAATQTRRLRNKGVTAGTRKQCPPGQIPRRAYVRMFSQRVKRAGYTRRTKSGKLIHVKPKARSVVVPAACVPDKGLPGKLPVGQEGIGPLRKGELKKYGYVYTNSTDSRHESLRAAMNEYGILGVWRKLDAAAKLTVRTRPEASKVFTADRDWIKRTFGKLKAF